MYGVHQPIRDKESSDSCDPSTTSSEGISSSTLSSDSNDSIFTVMKTKQTLQGNRLAVELVKIGGQCSLVLGHESVFSWYTNRVIFLISMFKNYEDRSEDVLLMGIRTPVFTLLAFVVRICRLAVVLKVVWRTLEVGVSSRC